MIEYFKSKFGNNNIDKLTSREDRLKYLYKYVFRLNYFDEEEKALIADDCLLLLEECFDKKVNDYSNKYKFFKQREDLSLIFGMKFFTDNFLISHINIKYSFRIEHNFYKSLFINKEGFFGYDDFFTTNDNDLNELILNLRKFIEEGAAV